MRAVNLLPREETKRPRARMTLVTQLAVISPFVVGSLVGAGYLLSSSKVNDNKATLTALQAELAAIPPIVDKPQTSAELVVQRDQRISALGLALQSRIAWDRILREISSVLPEDVWLTVLTAESPQAPAAAPPPPPETTTESGGGETTTTTATPIPAPVAPSAPLDIQGYTYSQEGVARFLSRLAVVPELTDVKLVSSTEAVVLGRTVVQFKIEADVDGEASS